MRFTSGRLAGTRAARNVLLAAGSAALAAGVVAGSTGLAAASVHDPGHGGQHGPGNGGPGNGGPGNGGGQPSTAPAFYAGIISQPVSPPSQGTKRHRHRHHRFGHHTSTATPTFVDVVQIFSSANGAPAGTLTFPSGQDVDSLARLGNDQSFVAATFDRSARVSHLYKFSIDSAGKPGALTPLSLPQVSGQVEAMAGSADGSTVAFIVEPASGGHQQVEVVRQSAGTAHRHPATGGVTTWNSSAFVGSPSLTADGSVLGFTASSVQNGQVSSTSQAWTLSTASRGGSLLRHAHQVPGLGSDAIQAALSPSGDQIWIEASTSPATLTLATTSTGAQVGKGIQLGDFGRLALDNGGQHMLAYGGHPGPGVSDVDLVDLGSGQVSTQVAHDPVIDGNLTTFGW